MKFFSKRKLRRKNIYTQRPILHNQGRIGKMSGIKNFSKENQGNSKKTLIIFSVFVLIFVIIYLVFFSNQFLIKNITVYQDHIKLTESSLQHYFNSTKGENIIFVNTDNIKDKILSDNPSFSKLEISKRLPSTLQIDYSEFEIVTNLVQNKDGQQLKFLINSEGVVAKKDVENPNLPYIKFNSTEDLQLNHSAIPREYLQYMLESKKYFEEKFGIKILDLLYIAEAREVHLKTEKQFVLWLDITQDYKQQLNKLKRALSKLDIYNDSFSYIDLRIAGNNGDKIIFKRAE